MDNEKILVTNIQRMSFHDGPGIRTTFFLKGCCLTCPWCANPENISFRQEKYIHNNVESIYGQFYTCDQLYELALKDLVYYDMDGGVTFSGGEPLLQFIKLEALLTKLKERQVHICVETSLYCNKEQLQMAIKYVNLFYVDIKILDESKCNEVLNVDVNKYFSNIEILSNSNCNYIFRIPVINGYTNTSENIELILSFLKKNLNHRVELLMQHNLGDSKYRTLNREPLILSELVDSDLLNLKQKILDIGVDEVEILHV